MPVQKLADLSTSTNPRLIDGILLTKFDTIDDKVDPPFSSIYCLPQVSFAAFVVYNPDLGSKILHVIIEKSYSNQLFVFPIIIVIECSIW